MWIIFIAALHGFLVIYAAHLSNSKFVTVLAAIGSASVAVKTGNPAYTVADLIGVAIGLWIGIGIIQEVPVKAPKPVALPVTITPQSAPNSWVAWVIAAVLFSGFFAYRASKDNKPPQQMGTTEKALPAAPMARLPAAVITQPASAPRVVTKRVAKEQKSALQRCLEIPSDDRMSACLERLNN